jgi:hypothetical protein
MMVRNKKRNYQKIIPLFYSILHIVLQLWSWCGHNWFDSNDFCMNIAIIM